MELYQLRTFVAVAEEGVLSRAAERLYVSQPAVSAHIKALEEELNVSLFDRTPKGMRLTESGRLLKDQAEKALASADEVLARAKALQEEIAGEIRVGFNTDPTFLRALDLLTRMTARHPKAFIRLCQCVSGLAPDDLRADVLDAAYVYGDADFPDVSALRLEVVGLRVAGPASWRKRLERASLDELAAMPWIMTPSTCPFTDLAMDMFGVWGLTPNKVFIADNESLLRALTVSEMGLCLMREDEAQDAEADGDVCTWPHKRLELPLSFIYLKRRENDRVIKALVEANREVWGVAATI